MCVVTWKSVFGGFIEQQRSRPACTSMQTDQRLCYSLIGKYYIKTCYKRNFTILACLRSWAGWFWSHSVGNPEHRISPEEAQIIYSQCTRFLYLWHWQAVRIQVSLCIWAAQTCQSLGCVLSQSMGVDIGSDQNSEFRLCWICQHGYLFESIAHLR